MSFKTERLREGEHGLYVEGSRPASPNGTEAVGEQYSHQLRKLREGTVTHKLTLESNSWATFYPWHLSKLVILSEPQFLCL